MRKRLSVCARLSGALVLVVGFNVLSSVSAEQKTEVTTLLKTTHSWDDVPYTKYPDRQPEVSILRYKIPANTTLPWHSHPVINAAYVVSGHITVTRKRDEKTIVVGPGDVLAEMVGSLHRGVTGDEAVELIVFYAGTPMLPLTVKPASH